MDWTDDDRRLETEQVALWESLLAEAKLKPKQALFEDLWLGFRKMGYRRTLDGHNSKVDALYYALQNEFLSLPGHAEYFRNKIENERAALKPKADRGGYDFNRSLAFEALYHLPSPETLQVLGNYLDDERDTPPERNWTPENAHLAAYALSRIGVRNFPIEGPLVPYRLTIWPDLKQLPDYRAWWEEVKSGQRTFSFKGQAVEYRFRPDGTWETIPIANPPDDVPKPALVAPESGKRDDLPAMADSEKPADRSFLSWIAGIVVVLLALALALFRKFRKAS